MLNGLSVDVEEWWHVADTQLNDDPEAWEGLRGCAEAGTEALLELLAARGLRATFFVLGWAARRYPRLVRRIAESGHELGVHGDVHRLVFTMTPAQFREDVRRARRSVEDACGVEAPRHRAASFSITATCPWAFDVLAEEGFTLDSSVFAGPRAHGGMPGADGRPWRMRTASGPLGEVPIPTVRLLGASWPLGGGGYLRLLPVEVTRRLVRRQNAAGRPAVVYVHPRELVPRHPRMALPLARRFKCYVGLDSFGARLSTLLDGAGPFGPLSEVLDHYAVA